MVIATFASEAELNSWWEKFQTGQGRKPLELAHGKPANVPRKRQDRGNRVGSDYLRPWSAKYDMPEYDLE
jgi:hypothetical protein